MAANVIKDVPAFPGPNARALLLSKLVTDTQGEWYWRNENNQLAKAENKQLTLWKAKFLDLGDAIKNDFALFKQKADMFNSQMKDFFKNLWSN